MIRRLAGFPLLLALSIGCSSPGTDEASGPAPHSAELERARQAVRELKKAGPLPKGGVAVNLRGGTYRRTQPFELGERDSGTLDAPVIYRAAPGEKVILSGGVEVRGFQPVADADAPGRLPEESRRHVVVLDLKAAGVTDWGSIKPRGYAIKPVPAHLELFFNSENFGRYRIYITYLFYLIAKKFNTHRKRLI